ncbi:MAG: hypothetical protein U9R79_06165 [Armatimonadota bacterium]|nr:hypothetical protein [Armatimonadota bacterium]
MDLAHWRYIEATHPVYDRPVDVERWEFATAGLEPDEYQVPEEEEAEELPTGQPYPQQEPLHMDVEGMPSLDWYQKDASGNTILTMRLNSPWVGRMDLRELVAQARAMFEAFKRLSRGPLSYDDLEALRHPYGYGIPGEPFSWERLTRPRKVPRYRVTLLGRRSLGHIRGMRGSVPTMSVVNIHTGEFERAWRWTYSMRGDGLTLTFWNQRKSERGAPVAWFLAHATYKMQAHGPWEVVPRRYWPRIVAAWRTAAQRAALEAKTRAGLYGREAV